MPRQKSSRIAIGGVFSALCLVTMFLSSVMPLSSFAMPVFAGAFLLVVVIENGAKTAFLAYLSVSLLSLFIVPDMDAKLFFILFMGYYPIIKPMIEKALRKVPGYAVKFLIFNAAMLLGYFLSKAIVGLSEADSELLGKYAPAFLLFGMNFSFVMYDYLLTRCTAMYINWFRPKFLKF